MTVGERAASPLAWCRDHFGDQREEAMRIAERLRWSGVGEVMLFDKRRRMVARSLGPDLVHPRAKK